jgi:hypothetical protein
MLPTQANSAWAHHNLNGQFSTLTATVGRHDDGTRTTARTVTFIGDGVTLATMSIGGTTPPSDIVLDVRGVSILRIEWNSPGTTGARIAIVNPRLH